MLDPNIFSPMVANCPAQPCRGSGFVLFSTCSRPTTIAIAFEGVIRALQAGQRALCLTHPNTVHNSFQTFSPLEALPSSQLQLLDFVYTSTAQEALLVLANIGMGEEDAPNVLLVDASSFDDANDQSGLLRLLALLDNTIRSLRELQPATHGGCFSITAVTTTTPFVSMVSHLHTTLPLFAVPNPVIVIEAHYSGARVSLVSGAADVPQSAGKRLLFETSLDPLQC